MNSTCRSMFPCLLSVCLACAAPAARAQWAVVDAPAIVQLIQQVRTLQQQLATARDQLQQARQTWQSTTGGRGMERLLSGTVRNYLPADWTQITSAMQGSGAFTAFSADIKSAIAANAVLTPENLAALSPAAQQSIVAARQWDAMQQVFAHQALANASNRFAAIQNLIGAIPSATDQKGILDLQTRVSAELGMLQNEQTKLQMLAQSAAAQESALRQQAVEQAIAGQGHFVTRFQPVP